MPTVIVHRPMIMTIGPTIVLGHAMWTNTTDTAVTVHVKKWRTASMTTNDRPRPDALCASAPLVESLSPHLITTIIIMTWPTTTLGSPTGGGAVGMAGMTPSTTAGLGIAGTHLGAGAVGIRPGASVLGTHLGIPVGTGAGVGIMDIGLTTAMVGEAIMEAMLTTCVLMETPIMG